MYWTLNVNTIQFTDYTYVYVCVRTYIHTYVCTHMHVCVIQKKNASRSRYMERLENASLVQIYMSYEKIERIRTHTQLLVSRFTLSLSHNICLIRTHSHLFTFQSECCTHSHEKTERIYKTAHKSRTRTYAYTHIRTYISIFFERWYEFPWHVEKSFSFHRFVYEIRSCVWKKITFVTKI